MVHPLHPASIHTSDVSARKVSCMPYDRLCGDAHLIFLSLSGSLPATRWHGSGQRWARAPFQSFVTVAVSDVFRKDEGGESSEGTSGLASVLRRPTER